MYGYTFGKSFLRGRVLPIKPRKVFAQFVRPNCCLARHCGSYSDGPKASQATTEPPVMEVRGTGMAKKMS